MSLKQTNKMATRSILPLLLTMSFPAMVSMFIQSMYNIVDSMFISHYSAEAFTAVSLAFPIQNLILAFAVGTGVGVNALVSRRLGEQNFKGANTAISHGLLLTFVTALIFILVGIFCIEPFFSLFTDSAVILALGSTYTTIITCLAFGTLFHIVIEKIFQATGKMLFPMIFQAVGAIVNIILDPILIFGLFGFPELGIEGAAWATIIGQFSAMFLAVATLFLTKSFIEINLRTFRFDWQIVRDIYTIGIPAIVITGIGSILVTGMNSILIRFSDAAVALFGIFFKLQSFIFMPILGLTQGAMPIIGFNFGAKNAQRIQETIKWSLIVSLLLTITGMLFFILAPSTLLQLFDASQEILLIGQTALPMLSLSFIPATVAIIFSTVFQATKRGGSSLVVALLRQGIIIIPLALILAPFFGLTGIWFTFIFAEVVAAATAAILFTQLKQREPIFTQHQQFIQQQFITD